MARYDYQCQSCGEVKEHSFPMAEKPPTVQCDCGGVMGSLIPTDFLVCVKGGQKPFKLDPTCVPIGWERGNTNPKKQQRRYEKIVNDEKQRALEVDKQAIKNGFRKIATQPREHFRMRLNQFGKDYYETDIKAKLKEDGLLFKD